MLAISDRPAHRGVLSRGLPDRLEDKMASAIQHFGLRDWPSHGPGMSKWMSVLAGPLASQARNVAQWIGPRN